MAQKKDNNLLLIAGAVVLYFLLFKKKAAKPGGGGGSGSGSGAGIFSSVTPQQKARIKADVSKAINKLNIEPEADEMDSFKKQYYQDIQQCKI